ncbi:MAG: hypothetical protein AAF805_09485 [Planctomycetota bacterium]
MELYDSTHDPTRDALFVARRPLVTNALVIAAFIVGVFAIAYAARAPWWGWTIAGLVGLLLTQMLVRTVADLRSSDNWVLALDSGGVWINLRRPGMRGVSPAVTVFRLPYREIESARKFTRRYAVRPNNRREVRDESHLELRIAADDSEVIGFAVAEEQRIEVPYRHGRFGGKSRVEWPMLVSVPQPGIVRIGGGVPLRALPRLRDRVRVEDPVHIDEGRLEQMPDDRFDAGMMELADAGQRVLAIHALTRRYGGGTTAAVDRLDAMLAARNAGQTDAGKMGKP